MTKNQFLFRKQATDYSSGKLKGNVLAKPRVTHIWFSIVACLWVLTLCYAMANFSYRKPLIVEATTFIENGTLLATVHTAVENLNKNQSDGFFPARIKGANDEWTHELRFINPTKSDTSKNKISSHKSSLIENMGLPANIFVNPDFTHSGPISDGDILEVKINEIDVNLLDTLFKRDLF